MILVVTGRRSVCGMGAACRKLDRSVIRGGGGGGGDGGGE